jgi:hypothetical protein
MIRQYFPSINSIKIGVSTEAYSLNDKTRENALKRHSERAFSAKMHCLIAFDAYFDVTC